LLNVQFADRVSMREKFAFHPLRVVKVDSDLRDADLLCDASCGLQRSDPRGGFNHNVFIFVVSKDLLEVVTCQTRLGLALVRKGRVPFQLNPPKLGFVLYVVTSLSVSHKA
jgi:hypothetical protein